MCEANYLKYKHDLRGYAEVLRVSHGNAPKNEGRAATLPATIDFSKTMSTYIAQRIEVLSAKYKPMCKYYSTYYLARPDQKVVCCGIYLNAQGQILPGYACDTDYVYRHAKICNADDVIWDRILEYNSTLKLMPCTRCEDYRTKINLLRPKDQRDREYELASQQEAQDEPSAEPVYVGDIKRYRKQMLQWAMPDTAKELEAAAKAKNYLRV